MLSVKRAHKLLEQHTPRCRTEIIPVAKAMGRVTAQDVRSPVSLPNFDNSAMDGFTLRASHTKGATVKHPIKLVLVGTVPAGKSSLHQLKSQTACRIMTGGMIPSGADTVLAKEDAVLENEMLVISKPLAKGKHIRWKGEEIKRGVHALAKNSVLQSGSLGFLASLGKDKIKVFQKPLVSVIVTGSELTNPGTPLKRGMIYNSNSVMMTALLAENGFAPTFAKHVKDRPEILKKAVEQAIEKSDILILTGGVSVGDYDYAKTVLRQVGFKDIFWRIAQKPGKPLYFAKKGRKLAFGLPGNPAGAFVCFYQHVYPVLRKISGHPTPYLSCVKLPITHTIKPHAKRRLFLKAKTRTIRGKMSVQTLTAQGSHMMSSLAEADCLVVVPAGDAILKKDTLVDVHLLPHHTWGRQP